MLFALMGVTACNSNEFPSPVENFTIDDFNDEFFENYSLTLISFAFPVMNRKAEFYTAFEENGYINFLINLSRYGFSYTSIQSRIRTYAVIIANELLLNFSIGKIRGVIGS